MIEIKEVKTKKDIKAFVKYPHKLYKDSKYYVPFLNIDEVNKFDKDKDNIIDQSEISDAIAMEDF